MCSMCVALSPKGRVQFLMGKVAWYTRGHLARYGGGAPEEHDRLIHLDRHIGVRVFMSAISY